MTKKEIETEIAEMEAIIASNDVPADEKDFAKDELKELKDKLANIKEPKHNKEREVINKTKPKFKKGEKVVHKNSNIISIIKKVNGFNDEIKQFNYAIHFTDGDKLNAENNSVNESELAKLSELKQKPSTSIEYDCDAIIAKAKANAKKRKEAAAKSANKSEGTKVKEAIVKLEDRIESKIDEMSRDQLTKLIHETKSLLAKLEAAFKKAK